MKLLGVVVACLLAACDAQAPQPAPPPPPLPPPDVGQINRFLECKAEPRRVLSPREQCEVDAFRARCTALDDCYVSCISSPDGVKEGGKCAHVCTFGPHEGAPHPDGVEACASLAGPSGI